MAGVNLRLDYVMANGECLSVAYGHLFNCVSLCVEDFQTLYADELLQKFIWHSDVFQIAIESRGARVSLCPTSPPDSS